MAATFQSLRMPIVLPLATIVTVGLFLMMRQLIDIGPVPTRVVEDRPAIEINFDVDPVEPNHNTEPEYVETLPPPPAEPIEHFTSAVDAVPSTDSYVMPRIEPANIGGPTGIVIAERDPSPIVRVQPVYPMRASERMLEGQCTMMFDITPQGTTTNVRALNCSSSLFESASLNAIAHWRYNPQVEDGQPTMFRGATTQLVYRLDE